MTYAMHETLEVHELAAFKAVCLTKAKTMKVLVSDPALIDILLQDVMTSTRQLEELGQILNNAAGQGGQA